MPLRWPSFKKLKLKSNKKSEIRNLRKKSDQTSLYPPLFCTDLKYEKAEYFSYTSDRSTLNGFSKHNIVWSMMKSQLDLIKLAPTWEVYNSLFPDNLGATPKVSSLLVISGSTADWSNLCTAHKIVQNTNITCTPQKKTIASLDIKLYAKCIQLQSKRKMSNNFLFRFGELYVVFTVLKILRKYINKKGLDDTFVEAEIYGLATIEQIKNGNS